MSRPSFPQAEPGPAGKTPPQVLLIGDSISIGYTPHVEALMKGEAVVVHHQGNAGHTGNGLLKIEQWLGTNHWDVIHFNFGLHDLCYRSRDPAKKGQGDKVGGLLTNTPEKYAENLELLVQRLEKTGAKLVWASTTIVPEGEKGRFVGDDAKYNAVAEKIMKAHRIPIDDLHTLSAGFAPSHFSSPGNVHYSKAGYEKLARQVASSIRAALK
ncbi:MAG: SGNH/GDSL hydrolase family protein [Kiritimatiellia bacterium]